MPVVSGITLKSFMLQMQIKTVKRNFPNYTIITEA
jgi:hypothetical protein